MTDLEFIQLFESCQLEKRYFNHQGHLRMAWYYLNKYGYKKGSKLIVDNIKRFAAFHHASHIYHKTLTLVWARLINTAITNSPAYDDFETFFVHNKEALSKDAPNRYYSQELLFSDKARKKWSDPDLQDFDKS